MNTEELQQILECSRDHSCCVDVCHVEGAPGYVRTTSIHDGPRVNIEFDVWGMDEGGLYFWASFDSLAASIECVGDYLGRPIGDWNASPSYPERPSEAGTARSHAEFRQLLTDRKLHLPRLGKFETMSDCWLQFIEP